MSRIGRGGSGIGTRMRGTQVPFDVDPELVEAVEAANDGYEDDLDDDSEKEIYPDIGEHITSAPITDKERREVQIWREMQAKRRAGPFWTGTKEDWAQIDAASGKSAEAYNPFEDAQTYGKRHAKRPFGLADMRKVKLDPRFFPKELWSTIGYSGEEHDDEDNEARPAKRPKKLGLAKKSTLDKLAKFDEGHEDGAAAESSDNEEPKKDGEDDEDFEREPEDDQFDEDEDDHDNDYNAEGYFDGGDEDFEEGGGDEYEDGY